MFKTLVSLVLIGLFLGVGAAVAMFMVRTAPKPAEKGTRLPPPLVQTLLIELQTVTETIVGYGSARPYRSAMLSAEVGGEIVELAEGLQDGSRVRAGQLLARIDERRYQQILEQATARARAQQAQLAQLDVRETNIGRTLAICEREVKVNLEEERRLAELFEQQAASKKEYDFARLAYQRSLRERTTYQNELDLVAPQREQLRATHQGSLADVEMARLDIEHCRIVAPFDGQIDELLVEVGEQVQRGSPIAGVIDPLRIEVPVQLPVSAYPRVAPGAAVELWVDSMPELRWSGEIERMSPDADAQSRTLLAYVVVDNREQAAPLVAGCFLRAEVAGPTLRDVLLVPRGAIVEGRVLVVRDLTARSRQVHVERFLGESAVVTGELEPGESVIVTNLDKVEHDALVRVEQPAGLREAS